MLSEEQFIVQSFNNGLFYLRSIRDYCVNIQLSFYKNNGDYSRGAEALAKRCEALWREIITATEGFVPSSSLQYQLFVTKFTLPCEQLTEKLFGITLATDITEDHLELKAKDNFENPSLELLNQVQSINQNASLLVVDFLNLALEIKDKLISNELFSYSYPSLYDYMIGNVSTYQNVLERLEKGIVADPVYITNREFNANSMMYAILLFLSGFINTSEKDYLDELDRLIPAYSRLLIDFQALPLSPENQRALTERSLNLVQQLLKLMENMLQDLLEANLYFIVEPLMIDQFYTDVNFVSYQLNEIEETQENF